MQCPCRPLFTFSLSSLRSCAARARAARAEHRQFSSVSYFTVPPSAHPSTGSQSGSATPGLTQVPSTRSTGGYSNVASEVNGVNLSQRTGFTDNVTRAAFYCCLTPASPYMCRTTKISEL